MLIYLHLVDSLVSAFLLVLLKLNGRHWVSFHMDRSTICKSNRTYYSSSSLLFGSAESARQSAVERLGRLGRFPSTRWRYNNNNSNGEIESSIRQERDGTSIYFDRFVRLFARLICFASSLASLQSHHLRNERRRENVRVFLLSARSIGEQRAPQRDTHFCIHNYNNK